MAAALSMPAQAIGKADIPAPTDELLSAARDGDRAALGRVLSMIERRVYILAFRLACDPVAAEDLAQEAMLKICRHIGGYRVGSNFWGLGLPNCGQSGPRHSPGRKTHAPGR